MAFLKFFPLVIVFLQVNNLYSFDLANILRHPETAQKNSVFIDVALPPLEFDSLNLENNDDEFEFVLFPVEIRLDYMLPIPLPFSVGLFMLTPDPNIKHFGVRAAYHFDIFDQFTDFYLLYRHDLGYLRNDVLLEHNDTPVEEIFYDFRAGVRRFFGEESLIALSVESGYQFKSIIIAISLKLN